MNRKKEKEIRQKFFIIDTHGSKVKDDNHHDDYDYIRYNWDQARNNKIQENDCFIYRKPGRNNDFKMFYFFGSGKFGNISSLDNGSKLVSSNLIQCNKFPKIITADNNELINYKWKFKDRKENSWEHFFNQYGITEITEEDYNFIINLGNDGKKIDSSDIYQQAITNDYESVYIDIEGKRQLIYSYKYERNPKLRKEALRIHGYTCHACGFNFYQKYGEIGKDFIEVHHINPLSEVKAETLVNPRTDLIPLCANCHRIIHRNKKPISVDGLKKIIDD
ncbi:MAG: HNH endonuclease [Erysipelothrix sp.]